ncbi:MAG: hypothetical protein IPM35_14630 [Myxococcales bacterium]|nr:hypothetical protein [Myxococcales bacterium]
MRAGASLFVACLAGFAPLACLELSDVKEASNPGGGGFVGTGGSAGSAGSPAGAGGGAPDGSAPAIRVLSGTASIAAAELGTSASLDPVKTDNAVLFFTSVHLEPNPGQALVRGVLAADGSSIAFQRAATGGSVSIAWYVLEHPEYRVQRGDLVLGGTTQEIAIADVDLARAFALASFSAEGSDFNRNDFVRIGLPSASKAAVSVSASNPNLQLAWQVVEVDTQSNVFGGQLTLGQSEAAKEAVLPSPFDMARSFIVHSWTADGLAAASSVASALAVKGRFKSPTAVELTRGQTGATLNVDFFAVRLGGASVSARNVTLPSGASSGSFPLAAFDPKRTFPVVSQLGARGNAVAPSWPGIDSYLFTARLDPSADGGASLDVLRGDSAADFDSEIYVVSF